METKPTLRQIFLLFLKFGTCAFGGVYSMLAFFEREIVRRKGWLSQDEFAEGVVIGQMTPGPPIVTTGIFIGYKLRKLKGALMTVLGQVLPSFLLILLLAHFYIKHQDVKPLQDALKGVGAAVVGLIVSVVFNTGKKVVKDYAGFLFSVVAFVCLAFLKMNPILLIVLSGVAGFAIFWRPNK